MARRIAFGAKTFRETFTFAAKSAATWFPGHMYTGILKMQAKLKQVDCIVEVHDARIPFSGRNPNFQTRLMLRPYILVLNKCDLIDTSYRSSIEAKLRDEGVTRVLWTNCTDQKDQVIQKELVPTILDVIGSSPRYHREEESDFNAMIIGIPNVGKSSLTNAIRHTYMAKHGKKGRATRVGNVAGVTRSVLEKIKVHSQPDIYFRDTPGILAPHIKSTEVGLKLALCATLQDYLVGEDVIVDYMLYKLNKAQRFEYVDYFKFDEPTDDVIHFLGKIATDRKWTLKLRNEMGRHEIRPDILKAANIALRAFRSGHLGKIMLDDNVMDIR